MEKDNLECKFMKKVDTFFTYVWLISKRTYTTTMIYNMQLPLVYSIPLMLASFQYLSLEQVSIGGLGVAGLVALAQGQSCSIGHCLYRGLNHQPFNN